MSFKVEWKPYNTILKNHGLEEDGRANEFLRDEVDRMCDSYMPMNNGALKRQKTYPSNHEIQYIATYAKYMYYGKLMLADSGSSYASLGEKKQLTSTDLKYQGAPKRGARWDKRMWQDRGKEICKDVEAYIKNGGK